VPVRNIDNQNTISQTRTYVRIKSIGLIQYMK